MKKYPKKRKEFTDEQKEWMEKFRNKIGINPIMDLYLTGEASFENVAKMNTRLIIDFCDHIKQLSKWC